MGELKRDNLANNIKKLILVGLDNAAWLLYASINGFKSFDDMIPDLYKTALLQHHRQVASIPVVSYGMSLNEILNLVEQDYFLLKIKLGQPGTQNEMLKKDKDRSKPKL